MVSFKQVKKGPTEGSAHGVEAPARRPARRRAPSAQDALGNHGVLRRARFVEPEPGLSVIQPQVITAAEPEPATVRTIAGSGVAGTGGPMPHLDRISPLFGHWAPYLEHMRAFNAPDECARIGARAYMTRQMGVQKAAFSDLNHVNVDTSVHEAIHGLEQLAGVQIAGGVGQQGDRYERAAATGAAIAKHNRPVERFLDGHIGNLPEGRRLLHAVSQRALVKDDVQVRDADGNVFPLSDLQLSQQQYQAVRGFVQRQEGQVQREPISLTVLGLALTAVGLIQAGITSSPSGLTLTYNKVAWPSAPTFATGMEEIITPTMFVESTIPVSAGSTEIRMRGRFGQGRVTDNAGREHNVPICTNVWFDVGRTTEWSLTLLTVTITHQASALGTTEDPQVEFIVETHFDPTGWGEVHATGLVRLHVKDGAMECVELRYTQGSEDVRSQRISATQGFGFAVGNRRSSARAGGG